MMEMVGQSLPDESRVAACVDAAGYPPETTLAATVHGMSGAAVIVTRGSVRPGANVQTYAASVAKQITAACVALLVRDRCLFLDEPAAERLAELPEWASGITIRHLLHHTAGLPSSGDVWARMETQGEVDWTNAGVLRALASFAQRPRTPGTLFEYSNSGYICLGEIVARLEGAPLPHVAQERLFAPLGMHNTLLWEGPTTAPADALVDPAGEARPRPLSVGDGGLWTTAEDLARWNQALLTDHLHIRELTQTSEAMSDGTGDRYGWGIRLGEHRGYRIHSHGGDWPGATAKAVRLPDLGLGLAALALDSAVGRMVTLAELLLDELIAASTAEHG